MKTLKRLLALLGALTAAAVLASWSVAPPAARRLAVADDPLIRRGAVHVHTTVSDGAGTPEDVARAARRAGLHFVVLTDHGDGTRVPAVPRVVDGVLLVDAVEISTTGGHYMALGLGKTPYRLAGEPRDVIEDVTRLGGFGIAAHPDSPKRDLSWREWNAPFPGLEWLNADSAWRDEPRSTLTRALAGYWWRSPETIAALLDRPNTTLARWDALSRRRRIVGVAGHDAHARIGARGSWDGAPDDVERYSLRVPSYEAAFRAFSTGVPLERPLDLDSPASAAAAILDAIRRGRVFTVIDGLAGPARLDLTAQSGAVTWQSGDEVPEGTAPELRATLHPATPGATVVLLRDGTTVSSGPRQAAAVHNATDRAAVYRAEVHLDGAPGTPPIPWMVSNAIRVGFPTPKAAPPLLPAAAWSRALAQSRWVVEKHPSSVTELSPTILAPENTAWTLTWQLGGGQPAGQYAAIAVPFVAGDLRNADRLSFTARGGGPMRVSVQLRSHARGGARWRRSVYLSATPVEISVPLREMTPVDDPPTTLDPSVTDSVLFVVDTVNTAPGSRGELWVSALRAEGADGAGRQVRTVNNR